MYAFALGVMAFVMTATPLAMSVENHSFPQSASVIQWHVFGMFGPALITGWLIKRLGVMNIITTGAVLNLGCMGLNLAGTSFWHFASALFLLGLGWNFMYVGSTTLLTETYRPEEKAKVQAAHDFTVFSFVALATFLSGRVFHRFNWEMLNHVSWPLILITLTVVLWLRHQQSGKNKPTPNY